MSNSKVAAIIAAAGCGKRFGGGIKKQFQPLGRKPLLVYSIESFEESPSVEEIILVVPEDSILYCNKILEEFRFKKVTKTIPGGEERQHSVRRGFNLVSTGTDIVVVHDAVRPFVAVGLIEEVIKEALKSGGAIAAVPIKDTVKKSSCGESFPNWIGDQAQDRLSRSAENYVERTIPRGSLWLAQTPQAFRYDILKMAYEKAEEGGFIGTDESSLVERLGVEVKLVEGSQMNMKITTEEDLFLGELVLKIVDRGL